MVGEPALVLDLRCGAGRFWPLLAEKQNRVIIGADNSATALPQLIKALRRLLCIMGSAWENALCKNRTACMSLGGWFVWRLPNCPTHVGIFKLSD